MKKFLLLIAAICTLQTAQAQLSISLSNPPTTVVGGYAQGMPLQATFDVINTGGQSLDISVARTMISEVSGSINNFCWGINCYPPNVSISPTPQTIPAGGIDNSFIADYEPQNNPGITTIKYCFFVAGTTDSVCTTINYDATNAVAGLDDLAKANKPGIELASANPVTDLAMFRYYVPTNSKEAKLVVHSITGSVVQEASLRKGNGNLILATNGLPAGMYVYSLINDGQVVSTQKLVIKH